MKAFDFECIILLVGIFFGIALCSALLNEFVIP